MAEPEQFAPADQPATERQQIEHLQAEVEELRGREAELRASLRRVLAIGEDATGVNAAQAQTAGALAGARAALAEERQRRRELEAELIRLKEQTSAAPAGSQTDDQELVRERERRQQLEQEAAQLKDEIAALAAANAGASAGDLAQERERRRELEAELGRLKQETSTVPYANAAAATPELASARGEVAQLRRALQEEQSAHERLADDYRRLQERGNSPVVTDSPELRARVEQLEQEKQRITESFTRSLAESQQRTAAVERELALARAAAAAGTADGSAINSVRAENATLRSQLEEEHRRTEDLANKLRMATRVTDLIFKMQSQQAQHNPQP